MNARAEAEAAAFAARCRAVPTLKRKQNLKSLFAKTSFAHILMTFIWRRFVDTFPTDFGVNSSSGQFVFKVFHFSWRTILKLEEEDKNFRFGALKNAHPFLVELRAVSQIPEGRQLKHRKIPLTRRKTTLHQMTIV